MTARPGGDLELRERFLLPSEAARLLGVATSTLRRWAEEGKIHSGTTIGGHRRYRESEITRLAQGLGLEEIVTN
ncbi:MAG: helix-turn-helix domain-containing protein [Actinobacteria bacterium]|nr:MAG: helix-turn-helix domain-containing protein [Actinomycetota bacterium]